MNRIERVNESAANFAALETPCLLLDVDRLRANCSRMLDRAAQLGVKLRPHLKTAKSLDVARIATGTDVPSITVSTLKEAECFAAAGYRDVLYAAAVVPQKFSHAARIQQETGCDLMLVADALPVARAAADFAGRHALVLFDHARKMKRIFEASPPSERKTKRGASQERRNRKRYFYYPGLTEGVRRANRRDRPWERWPWAPDSTEYSGWTPPLVLKDSMRSWF